MAAYPKQLVKEMWMNQLGVLGRRDDEDEASNLDDKRLARELIGGQLVYTKEDAFDAVRNGLKKLGDLINLPGLQRPDSLFSFQAFIKK